jgi:MinD superfamily P-loop ATPase
MPAGLTVSVASGKGDTGKTTVAVNLALALSDSRPVQFLDCDVEEPNAFFFLKPRIETSEEVAILFEGDDRHALNMAAFRLLRLLRQPHLSH